MRRWLFAPTQNRSYLALQLTFRALARAACNQKNGQRDGDPLQTIHTCCQLCVAPGVHGAYGTSEYSPFLLDAVERTETGLKL
jgi:hypothetical protein